MAGTSDEKLAELRKLATSGTSKQTFRVPTLPNLHEHVSQHGLMDGLQVYQQAMEEWKQQLEKSINAQLAPTPDLPPSQLV